MTIIVAGDKTFQTGLEPTVQSGTSDDHPHTQIQMSDTKLLDGQIHLKEDHPAGGKFIICEQSSGEVFTVQKDGFVECESLLSTTGMETINDGTIAWKPANNTGLLRIGRQQDTTETKVGLLDGIRHQRTIDGTLHVFEQQLHPEQPKLSIIGETNSGVDWLSISESDTGIPIFSVHDDGTLETRAWRSVDNKHADAYAHSVATSGDSIYIGQCKLSDDNGLLKISQLKGPPYIPQRLTSAPYSFTTSNINANTSRSVNDWMVLARWKLRQSNLIEEQKLLRIRDVFAPIYAAQDFEMSEGFPEKHLGLVRVNSGAIKAQTIELADNSAWLGERLHITYDSAGKKTQLLTRKEVIPKYLTGLGVQVSDVTALGKTVATLTLGDCQTLSSDAGGSASLSTIFPQANLDDDFETNTIFNEITVKSNHPGDQSGIDIENSSSHPIINFKGSSSGRGLIQFQEDGVAKGLIYSSGAQSALKIESVNEKLVLEDSLELSGNDIVVKSGKTLKYEGGTDLQTQINNLDSLYSTDAERVSAVNTLVTNYTAADTSLQNTLQNSINTVQTSATANGVAVGQLDNSPTTIWVDASRSDSYTEAGSRSKPYKTLTAALSAKLSDGATTSYIFRLLPGTYSGGVSIDHSSKTQSFKIEGSGRDVTIIESASSFASGKDTNVLYLRDFVSIEICDVTIRNGLYGFYPRSVDRVVCERVKFVHLGSAGTVNRHDQSGTQAEQAAYWASASTSSGGACRIRDVGQLQVADCEVEYCLRGLRIQDVGSLTTSSSITNCRTFRTSEAGIYLASGTYTGAGGCINMTISGCTVCEAFNNGILVIGGQYCAVQGCTVLRSANAGIQGWHSLDLTIADNTLMDCNRRTYNGIGNLGDAWANCEVTGNTAIGTGTYMAVIKGNTISNGGQGRGASVIGFSIQRTDAGGAFPTASNKFVLESNVSDCATRLSNSQSIPRTKGDFRTRIEALESETHISAAEQAKLAAVSLAELGYLSGTTSAVQTQLSSKQASLSFGSVSETGKVVYSQDIKTYGDANWSGGGATNPILLQSAVANTPAKITLENTAVNGTTEFEISKLTDKDRTWRFKTHNQDELKLECDQGQYGIQQSFRIAKNGNVCILGQGQSTNEVGSYTFRTMGSVLFEHDKFVMTSLPTSDPGTANRLYNDNTNLKISSGTTDEPVIRSTSHENPSGGYTNWLQLPYSCKVLSIEQAQSCRRRLPLSPSDGHEIKIIFPLGTGTLNLHTGAHVVGGVYRQVYYKSTGYASQYQCNINATSAGDMYTCVFIEATNKWFLK